MTEKLTELKSKLQEVTDLIKEYELLEEARRRGYKEGVIIDTLFNTDDSPFTMPIEEPFKVNGTSLTDSNDRLIYYNGEWAEIIPEEEKKEEIWQIKEMEKLEEFAEHELKFPTRCGESAVDMVIRVLSDIKVNNELIDVMNKPEKSLHNQIREGGWDKVFELGDEGETTLIFDLPEDDPIANKTNAFYRLLALSKVLNEGKERGGERYTVVHTLEGLEGMVAKNYIFSIEFHTEPDRNFAMKFAEKEWKIFYNSKDV